MIRLGNNTPWRSSVSSLRRPLPSTSFLRFAMLAGLITGIALRVRSLGAKRLWGDEVFNYSVSLGTWITLIKRVALDMAHPPLFYLLLKPWIYVAGSSMAGLRVLNVVISIAAFAPFIALGRQLKLPTPEIALAVALMAINSYLILYSYYLRPFSLLLFLTLCSHVSFIKLLECNREEDQRAFAVFVVVNVLLVYTNYFGWLVFAAECFWVLATDRKHLRQMAKGAVILILSYLPWIAVIVYTSTKVTYTFWDQISWTTPPGSNTVVALLRSFNGGFRTTWLTVTGSAAFALLIFTALKNPAKKDRKRTAGNEAGGHSLQFLVFLFAFPIVFSLVAAYLLTLVWEPRYVIVSIGPYLLALSMSAFRPRLVWVRAFAVTGILAWAVIGNSSGDLATDLHGPNGVSYDLALQLSRKEDRSGPIPVYGLSPYAEQGLVLALSLIGERRFQMRSQPVNDPLTEEYFWLAVTEHDPLATARVRELRSDPSYLFGDPLYAGAAPQRHMLFPVHRTALVGRP